MREASAHSEKIVMDLGRSKLHQTRALGYIKQLTDRAKRLKRVLKQLKQGLTLKRCNMTDFTIDCIIGPTM